MRACATVNAVLLGAALGVATFAACSNGSTTAPPPALPDTQSTAPPGVAPATASAAVSAAPAPAAPPNVGHAPDSAAECKQLPSDTAVEPTGGLVMNNAMTAGDAGSSDRLLVVAELIKSRRPGFRCCYDLWARKNQNVPASVSMVINLKPDGSVTSVAFQEPGPAPEVASCIADLARSLTYPRSPAGKETRLTYPFDFKSHR